VRECDAFIDFWGLKNGALTEKIQARVLAFVLCPLLRVAWAPFIASRDVPANYPSITYKCGILTYVENILLCRVA
jgi:hypothetical protein